MYNNSVLLIEPASILRKLISRALKHHFSTTALREASTGADTVKILEMSPELDMVIMSDDLPDISAADLLHAIRVRPELANLPALVIGSDWAATADIIEKHERVALLQKPFSAMSLVRAMRSLMVDEEKRAFERYVPESDIEAKLTMDGTGDIDCFIEDISLGGAKLMSYQKPDLPRNARMLGNLAINCEPGPVRFSVQVMRVMPGENLSASSAPTPVIYFGVKFLEGDYKNMTMLKNFVDSVKSDSEKDFR